MSSLISADIWVCEMQAEKPMGLFEGPSGTLRLVDKLSVPPKGRVKTAFNTWLQRHGTPGVRYYVYRFISGESCIQTVSVRYHVLK